MLKSDQRRCHCVTVSLADFTLVQLACMPAQHDCTLGTVLPNITDWLVSIPLTMFLLCQGGAYI